MGFAQHGANVQANRAITHAATAASAADLVDLIQPVAVFVTQPLTSAFHTAGARVVTGSFERIGAEHAGVPIAHAFTALGFVDDVETEAGWAEERAHSTAQTGARNFFPVGTGEVLIELLLKPSVSKAMGMLAAAACCTSLACILWSSDAFSSWVKRWSPFSVRVSTRKISPSL